MANERAETEGVVALRQALLLTAGALNSIARDQNRTVRFTGEWAHLGSHAVASILDQANSALAATTEFDRDV